MYNERVLTSATTHQCSSFTSPTRAWKVLVKISFLQPTHTNPPSREKVVVTFRWRERGVGRRGCPEFIGKSIKSLPKNGTLLSLYLFLYHSPHPAFFRFLRLLYEQLNSTQLPGPAITERTFSMCVGGSEYWREYFMFVCWCSVVGEENLQASTREGGECERRRSRTNHHLKRSQGVRFCKKKGWWSHVMVVLEKKSDYEGKAVPATKISESFWGFNAHPSSSDFFRRALPSTFFFFYGQFIGMLDVLHSHSDIFVRFWWGKFPVQF